MKSIRIGDKARGAGFDWDKPEDVWGKIKEELGEFEDSQKSGNQEDIEGEFGDLMFSLINFARLSDIDPELALERTNKKFIFRFTYMEKQATIQGKELSSMTLVKWRFFGMKPRSCLEIISIEFIVKCEIK